MAVVAGIAVAISTGMELLGRIATVVGISLVLTMLLVVLYQDENPAEPAAVAVTQATNTPDRGAP